MRLREKLVSNNQSYPTDFDGIFQHTLNASYDGPVPEIVLYRLLSAVELVIRRELSQGELNQELASLRVGYLFKTPETTEYGQLYWVGWGYHPDYNEILDGQEIFDKTFDYSNFDKTFGDSNISIANADVNFLSDECARQLVYRLEAIMQHSLSGDGLQGKQVYPFVFGHLSLTLIALTSTDSHNVMFGKAFSCSHRCDNGQKCFKPKPGLFCFICL